MAGVRVRLGVSLVAAVLATACSKGGGGGGGGSGLAVAPTSVAFRVLSTESGGVASTVRITWTSASVAGVLAGVPAGQSLPGWLELVSLTGGASPLTLTLRIPPGTRTPGHSVQTVRVVTGDASGNLLDYVDFPVTLDVIAAPSLSATTVPLSWVESELPAAVPLTVTRDPAVTLTGAAANVTWLAVTRSGDALTLSPTADAAALPPGPHAATVTVSFSLDGRPFTRPVAVSGTVLPALSAAGPIAFQVNATTTDAGLTGLRGTVVTATQAALTLDPSVDVTWLSAGTPAVTGSAGNLALAVPKANLAELPNGVYHGSVTLTPRVVNVTPLVVPVTLTVNLPEVHGVMPVAFTDTAATDYVVVRGAGFAAGGAPLVDGAAAASADVLSDGEVHLVPGAVGAGDHVLSLGNQLGLPRDTAVLRVIPPPSYATTTLTGFTIATQDKILPSPVNGVVFTSLASFSGPGKVQRFAYVEGSGWSRSEQAFTALYDIALTPDEAQLIVLTATQLLLVDPGTMATIRTVNLPASVSGVASQLAVLNDGQVLIQDLDRAWSLRDGTFTPVPGLSVGVGFAGSRDGSRAFFGSANYYGSIPYRYYDAVTDGIVVSGTYQHWAWGKISRHGERALANAYLVDDALAPLVTLPSPVHSAWGDLSPDGRRVYSLDSGAAELRRYDVSDPANVVELTAIPVPSGALGRIATDPRGDYVYVVGPSAFVVVDVR